MRYNLLRLGALGIFCCFVCAAAGLALAQDRAAGEYPERGKVIAHTSSAKASAGGVAVFRVETETRIYEFEEKAEAKLAVGDVIQFRIEGDWAYVASGAREQKFRVIDTQLKDDD